MQNSQHLKTSRGELAEISTTDVPRHLQILRQQLARDNPSGTQWHNYLRDLATMVARSVEAPMAMVALYLGDKGRWLAITHSGQRLDHVQISSVASLTALEQVRTSGEALIAAGDDHLELDSESIRRSEASSMLVVPLFFWDVTSPEKGRELAGCVYAHRTLAQPSFRDWHTLIVSDLTRLAQPTLNLARHLGRLEEELETARGALEVLAAQSKDSWQLGSFSTQDATFARQVLHPLKQVGKAERVHVMLLGPTGAGKTHLAAAWHRESSRCQGPFVVMDCAQVTSSETLGAELFGYAPDSGYANSPRAGRAGKAQLAHKGTLFIDEIACLPAELQQRLLRLVETGEFTPLGGSDVKKVDLQIVSATLEDLPSWVKARRFREDLYWRLSDLVVYLPPLSERKADIPALAQDFLDQARHRTGRRDVLSFRDDAIKALVDFGWDRAGNIRGLERSIFRSLLMAPANIRRLAAHHLEFQDLGALPQPHPVHSPAGDAEVPPPGKGPRLGTQEQRELQAIKEAILKYRRATEAARVLGMTYRELTWRLHKVGLSIKAVLAEG